jgi:hypothetical protein
MNRRTRSNTTPRGLVAVIGAGAAILLATCQGAAPTLRSVPAIPSIPLPSSLALPSGLPQAFVQFQAQGGSTVTGGAVLSDSAGQTTVVIGLIGGDTSSAMPAILFTGDCTSVPGASTSPSASASASGAARFQLSDVVAGTSTSTVSVAVSELTGTPHAIAVLAAGGAAIACGAVTTVAPSGLPSLLPGGSAAPSASAPSASPAGSMTEPSPST